MKEGTFLVTDADGGSAVLRDVAGGQVHTLAGNPDPGLEAGDVLEARIEPEQPLEVVWRVAELRERRTIPVERSDEPPTRQAEEIAADRPVGEVVRRDRAGEGRLHVLTVPPGGTEAAAADVAADEATRERAARLGVGRVEVRAAEGVVSVRYLP